MLFTQVWNSYTFQFWKEKCNRLQAVKTLICLSLINVIIRYLFVCNYWYLSPVSISGQDRHDLTSFVCKKNTKPRWPWIDIIFYRAGNTTGDNHSSLSIQIRNNTITSIIYNSGDNGSPCCTALIEFFKWREISIKMS